jgi:hypothetical protein
MDHTDYGELSSGGTCENLTCLTYLVEDETGYCHLYVYSDLAIRERGGLLELEADLFAKFPWFERLGTILIKYWSDGGIQFSEDVIQRLVFRSSRRMVRTPNWAQIEYMPVDSQSSLRN